MISITVKQSDAVREVLDEIGDALTGSSAAALSEQGGLSARNAAIVYHREFDQSGGWRGKRYLGAGGNEGGDFGSSVARGWSLESFDAGGAVISNDADHYAFKVTGGTITPKRASALTIPLIPEARGLFASVYTQNTGRRLFSIRGKNALFERTEEILTGSRGRKGQAGSSKIRRRQIRAVYALVKSVTMGPWTGAVPPDEVLADAYADEYSEGLSRLIERL